MANRKTISQRILEAKNIRLQLQKIGAFLVEENREKIKIAMNAYVSLGDSTEILLNIDKDSKARVFLSSKPDIQSGITLEHY